MSRKPACIFCYVFCLMLLAGSALANTNRVTITTGEFPPWTGAELPEQGYVNQIVAAAFAAVGVDVHFVYMPWSRAYREAAQGRFHATSYWYASESRQRDMLFSQPLIQNRTVFFQQRERPGIQWQTLEDLAPYRIAGVTGYTYTPNFLTAIDQGLLDVTLVNSDTQGLKMLMANRVDLFACDQISGLHLASQLGIDSTRLQVVEPALASVDGYLMVSRARDDAEELIETFNRGLSTIQRDGTYQAILDHLSQTAGPLFDPPRHQRHLYQP